MKRGVLIACVFLLVAAIVLAQGNKLEVATLKNESFKPGENVTFKVALYDSSNNPVNADISVTLKDAEEKEKIEKTLPSNQFVDINLGKNASYGYWKITAKYQDIEASTLFVVEMNEQAKFELNGDTVTILNTGNVRYAKTIQILIGDTFGTKEISLDVGEKTRFRLVAPDGIYNVRITDGKAAISQNDVSLTGNIVGIDTLDEQAGTDGSTITGTISPEKEEFSNIAKTSNRTKFVYFFVVAIIGATILLAIERNYRKKVG